MTPFTPTPRDIATLTLVLELRAQRKEEEAEACRTRTAVRSKVDADSAFIGRCLNVANTYRWISRALTDREEFDRLLQETLAWATSPKS